MRQDWPRVPLPADKQLLQKSAALGRQVAALLDPETPVAGVTSAKIHPELKPLGVPSRVGGGQLDPAKGDLDVTARWGIAGKGGIVMPSKGKVVERACTQEELSVISSQLSAKQVLDVHLNGVAYWRCVPQPVWDYTLGGYQVIKKWLSYREKALLGRGLKLDEVTYVRDMIRRIAAVLLLQAELDANYTAVKAEPYTWASAVKPSGP